MGKGKPKKLPDVITEKEFLDTIKQVKRKDIKLAFMLGFYQCMRVSEVVGLKPEDVDMKRGFIHIKQAKGSKDRFVPIMPPIKHGLRQLPIGIGIRALQKQTKKHFPSYHFHSLRHSGATFYLKNKVDIRYIQNLLGHSRLDTTQIYTHIGTDDMKEKFEEVWK